MSAIVLAMASKLKPLRYAVRHAGRQAGIAHTMQAGSVAAFTVTQAGGGTGIQGGYTRKNTAIQAGIWAALGGPLG